MVDLSTPQRQSPLAVVFLGVRILRNIGLVQLAIAAFFLLRSPLNGVAVLATVVVLLFGVVSVLAWWRYTFQVIDGELVVNKGVLRADRLTISADRIQSLAIDQELLHRLTGLVKVSVDTAGTAEAEFTIDAIARPLAEELQRQVVTAAPQHAAIRPEAEAAAVSVDARAAAERVIFTHPPKRLLITALTVWPLAALVLLAPLFAFGDQIRDELGDDVPDIDPGGFQWWWVPAAIFGVLAISVALNIAQVFLGEWQLTLRATATSLRRTSGLLSRTSKASTVARVQVVSSTQNPLQRRAGIRQVQLSTIGDGDLILVGCDDKQLATVRRLAHVDRDLAALDRRIHPAQTYLAVRNALVVLVPVAVVGALFLNPFVAALPLLAVAVWLVSRREVRTTRWGIGSELALTKQVVSTETRQTSLRKTNVVSVTQTIFQRRRSLAQVDVVTAAGTVSIGMLALEEAHALRDLILAAVETDRLSWM